MSMVSCGSNNKVEEIETYTWDLSESNHISQIDWVPTNASDIYSRNDVIMNLKLPNGHQIEDWYVRYFIIEAHWRYDLDHIQSLRLALPSGSVDEIRDQALVLAEEYNLDKDGIDIWYKEMHNEPPLFRPPVFHVSAIDKDKIPAISLLLNRGTPNNRDYTVSLDFV